MAQISALAAWPIAVLTRLAQVHSRSPVRSLPCPASVCDYLALGFYLRFTPSDYSKRMGDWQLLYTLSKKGRNFHSTYAALRSHSNGYTTRAHVRQTLKSIRKYNHRKKLTDHFNCMRSYALGDESALLMASYPHERPDNPFPYFTEVMTGFEYTAAIGMLYEGQLKNGLQTMRDIRNRYDGAKRSPFDEAECGHHYARAMVAWAGVLALTGFNYSGVTKSIAFAAELGTFFWSNGAAWGTVCIAQRQSSYRIALDVLYGQIKIKHFRLTGVGEHTFDRELVLRENSQRTFVVG